MENSYEKAEQVIEKALQISPNHTTALCGKAIFIQETCNQYDAAEKIYLEALSRNKHNADALCFYATFVGKAVFKKFDQAEMLYRRVLNISEMFSPAWSHFLLSVKGDHDKAEELYRRAYEVDPKDAINLCNYAHLVEVFRKDYERAENLYKEALLADPSNVAVLCNYGHLLARSSKDLERAEEMLKQAVKLDPSYEDAAFGLSVIRSKVNARRAQAAPARNPLHEKMYRELQRRRDVRSVNAEKKRDSEEQTLRADRMAEMLLREEADLEAKRGQGDAREGNRRGRKRF
eukprot:752779-Hanusia_phi.AAC.4